VRERVNFLRARGPVFGRQVTTTNAAARELDRELTMPLSLLVQEAIRALEKRPFGERIKDLARDQKKPKQIA
jgi:hypothetical protein